MKKNFTFRGLLLTIFALFSLQSYAQDFEGVITYKITVTGSGVTDDIKAMMAKSMILTIKGDKSRTEMSMGMGKTVTAGIADAESKTAVTLMDMMGQKFAIKMNSEEIIKEMGDTNNISVETTNETKEILGYTCKKAIITSMDDSTELTAYFTDELGTRDINFDNRLFRNINGVMLEYEIPNKMFTMHFEAVSVEKKNIDESEFTIPDGYQIKTKEEINQMFGDGQ
jgi:GLPGLI family protein